MERADAGLSKTKSKDWNYPSLANKRENTMIINNLNDEIEGGAGIEGLEIAEDCDVGAGDLANYKGIYAPEKKESKKENSGVKNSEMAKKIPVQNELKEFGTILKRKKKERGNNMLQMDKGSRTKVLEKNKLKLFTSILVQREQ